MEEYFCIDYCPVWLDTVTPEEYPVSFLLKGVKHFSYKESYCESAAFQMVLSSYGYYQDIREINFMTGFTYGAFYSGNQYGFIPYNDPVIGTKVAASNYKLRQRYFCTDNERLFVGALRFYLSGNFAISIQLNEALLLGGKGVYPHCELLVGYNTQGFYYYPTSQRDSCQELPLFIDNKSLLLAVRQLNCFFERGWKYAFYIFERSSVDAEVFDFLQRNGLLLRGARQKHFATGSYAIKEFANDIRTNKVLNMWALEALFYTRRHNAEYFKYSNFPYDIRSVSVQFVKAAECYKKALEICKGQEEGRLHEIVQLINEGADVEFNIADRFSML